jgi:hypothetical protein
MAVVLVFNQHVLHKASQQSVHLTLGILRTSQAVFYASAFSQSDGFAVPAHTRVTQTVRRLVARKVFSKRKNYAISK